jgi:hypothetical protein
MARFTVGRDVNCDRPTCWHHCRVVLDTESVRTSEVCSVHMFRADARALADQLNAGERPNDARLFILHTGKLVTE